MKTKTALSLFVLAFIAIGGVLLVRADGSRISDNDPIPTSTPEKSIISRLFGGAPQGSIENCVTNGGVMTCSYRVPFRLGTSTVASIPVPFSGLASTTSGGLFSPTGYASSSLVYAGSHFPYRGNIGHATSSGEMRLYKGDAMNATTTLITSWAITANATGTPFIASSTPLSLNGLVGRSHEYITLDMQRVTNVTWFSPDIAYADFVFIVEY